MSDPTDPTPQLPASASAALEASGLALRRGDFETANRHLDAALAVAKNHPDPRWLEGVVRNAEGRHDDARRALSRALAMRPDDAAILVDLGNAEIGCGEREAAYGSWRRACTLAPDHPMPWYNLGRNLQLEGRTGEALEALERASALAADFLPARILFADALAHAGRFDEADHHYREAIWRDPACGDAWRGLVNMKTRSLAEEDRDQLALNHGRADIAARDRIAMGYALGKALEDAGREDEAFAVLEATNAEQRAQVPWDRVGFGQFVDAVVAATPQTRAHVDPNLGEEAIFIVGLPRSGSTLVEQILAAHPAVEGASELPDLGVVIAGESARRGLPFPRWVADAEARDWHRLGSEYLRRTECWRTQHPRFTDKMPENWLYAGVLRAMLPGAHMIETQRDPLETGWSCFKQQFYVQPHFSCDLADIGGYLRTSERALAHWRALDPGRLRLQSYEALLQAPEHEIRSLLSFCDLPFDAACLEFHRALRSVRTPSASQVRQPLRTDTARAARYGARLDPLRDELAADSPSPSGV